MKRFLALVVLVIVGVGAWQVGAKLSADAIGMGVGVVFGVLAGIPTALLLLAGNRRRDAGQAGPPQQQYPRQPPVIVIGGPARYDDGYAPALPEPRYQQPAQDRIRDDQAYYEQSEYRRLDQDEEW